MKHTFILLMTLVIYTPIISPAQRTTEFEYVFHFEDAIDNQDSVTIGYDLDASYDFPNGCFDPEFGEVKLTHPFDSIFEVRVSHDAFNVTVPGTCNYFLKKTISDITIYPNPVLDILNIGIDDEVISALTISSIEGEVVKRGNARNDKIDVSELKLGIYILKAHINDKYWIVKKFCKM